MYKYELIGSWVFLFGSLLFLLQAITFYTNQYVVANISNIASASLFVIGSILFIKSGNEAVK
jgi:hypothetical protein